MRGVAMLVVVGLLGVLAAQERRPAFVVVQDAQGRPLAGARVTCFASPTFVEAGDDVDVVEGVAEERGRVVCKLLTHRIYSAFAIVDGAQGSFRASEVRENVAAGGEIVLPVTIERRPQHVVLDGEAAWQHLGPLRLLVAPEAQNRLLLAVTNGRVPKLPSLGCVLVHDARGQPLWSQTFHSHQPWRPVGDLPPQFRDPVVVELPPPHALPVRVVAADGTPVANAELWQPIEQSDLSTMGYRRGALPRPAWRAIGRTGDDGTAKVQVAVAADRGRPRDLLIEARAGGFAHSIGGVAFGQSFDGRKLGEMPANFVLTITLAANQRLHVQPPAAHSIALFGRADGPPIARAGEEGPLFLRSDAAGTVDLPLAIQAKAVRVARLQREEELPIWSIVAPDGEDSVASAAAREIRVSVTDALGNPARGQHVVLIPWVNESPGIDLPMPLDHAGRTTLRVVAGTWFLWCCNGVDAAWRVVAIDDQDFEVALPMRRIPRATVRFLDAAGKPRPAFRVRQWPGFEWDAKPSVENRFLIERQIGLAVAQMPADTTDAEGCLHYLMLPLPEARLHFGGSGHGLAHSGPRPGGIEPGRRTDHVIE